MGYHTYNFETYPASAVAKFDCPACGKPKRKRTFTHECTVNPFNKRPDGVMRTAREVSQQSATKAMAERDAFMLEPICSTCEGKLAWNDRCDWLKRRRDRALGQGTRQKQETR